MLLEGQVDQLDGDGVAGERHHPADVGGRDTCPDQRHRRLGQVRGRGDHIIGGARVGDRPSECERGAALEIHQVGGGDQSDGGTPGVDHGYVVDARVEHVDHHVDRQPIRPECDRRSGHQLLHRGVETHSLSDQLAPQIRVGEHSKTLGQPHQHA